MEVQYRYEPFYLEDIMDGKTIKVPQFQRNVVWNFNKKKAFIDNLRDGNPFGSILVHQVNNDYLLIDGLQRITTIKDFMSNPHNYFDYSDIDFKLVEKLLEITYSEKGYKFDSSNDTIVKNVELIRKDIFYLLCELVDDTEVIYTIRDKYSLSSDIETHRKISEIISDFKRKKDISKLFVPTIIFTGKSEKLPAIFYHLNTGGVSLSKYETLSALWDQKRFIIDCSEINSKIANKYIQLRENSDLEVDVSIDDITENGVTLFEYCYAISEIFRDKSNNFSVIIGTNKKSTDPFGFEILSLICGLPVNKAEKLDSILINATPKFLVELKDVIKETFSVITTALNDWVIGSNGFPNTVDGIYMIYHIAIAYIRNNYNLDFENFQINSIKDGHWNSNFKKYLHLHYLKDSIDDYWKKNRQVTDLQREVENTESLNKYATNISSDSWSSAIDYFMERQSLENNQTISSRSKLFLDYLLKFKQMRDFTLKKYIMKNYTEEKIKLDYEHIVPLKRISLKLSKNEMKKIPVSSLGNLCFLPSTDNRAKKEKTIYEFIDNRPSFVTDEEYLSFINYPSKHELKFIDFPKEEFIIEYNMFLKSRLNNISNEFINLIKEIYM